MSLDTLLDAPLPHKICACNQAAQHQAMREAADTGGIVLRVKSIKVEPHRTVFTGLIPSTALAFEHPSDLPACVRPRSVGTLHLSEASLNAVAGDDIGYLVLQTPIAAVGLLPESEDGDSCWVSVAVEGKLDALAPGFIGAVCCARCHRPISPQRLLAVPNTKVCTHCQKKKEQR